MAKYYGNIGFSETVNTSPGVWTERITERKYYGDVNRLSRRWEKESSKHNDNLNVSHEISIVSDPYANEHFTSIKYAEWAGAKWQVSYVEVRYPRLILSIGGVYNGQQT